MHHQRHIIARFFRPAAALLIIALAAPSILRAQEKTPPPENPAPAEVIRISADEVTWLRQENIVELHGNVVIEHPEYRVTAREARANLDTKIIRAKGDVQVVKLLDGQETEILSADEVEVSTDAQTGWMVNARLEIPWKKSVFVFHGSRFQRIDDHTYLIEQGSFTWCECQEGEPADWSVEADRIEADTEDDAVLKGARVYLRGRKFLSLPYLRYPISGDRQSGFLFPEIETSSSDGIQIQIPYYWVVSRSADVTVSPRWIEERGVDGGAEARYNFGEAAHGEVRGFYIEDGQEGEDRGGVRLIHRTDFGDAFTAAVDAAYITDNEVLFDFDHRELGEENQRALESRAYFSYHQPTMNLTAEFSAFNDLMGGDVRSSRFGEDRDSLMVQRLPAVTYTLLAAPLLGPLMFDVSAMYVNYYREDVAAGRGQMLMFNPSLGLPWRFFDAVDFWAGLGYREWYVVPDEEFHRQTSAVGRSEAEMAASAQWQRIYRAEDRVFRHSFRPTLLFYYLGDPDDPEDPFFQGVVPNGVTNLAGIRLDSRLWQRKTAGRDLRASETARVELTQFYDFENRDLRDLRVEGRLGAPSPWRVYFDNYYSHQTSDWSKLSDEVGYVFNDRNEVRVGYRYTSGEVYSPYFDFEASPEEAIIGAILLSPDPRRTYEYTAYYSLRYDRMVKQSLDIGYTGKQKCWNAGVTVSDRVRPTDPDGEHVLSASFRIRVVPPGGQ